MALMDCVECGKQVSDKAANCPHCGAPVVGPGQNSTGNSASSSADDGYGKSAGSAVAVASIEINGPKVTAGKRGSLPSDSGKLRLTSGGLGIKGLLLTKELGRLADLNVFVLCNSSKTKADIEFRDGIVWRVHDLDGRGGLEQFGIMIQRVAGRALVAYDPARTQLSAKQIVLATKIFALVFCLALVGGLSRHGYSGAMLGALAAAGFMAFIVKGPPGWKWLKYGGVSLSVLLVIMGLGRQGEKAASEAAEKTAAEERLRQQQAQAAAYGVAVDAIEKASETATAETLAALCDEVLRKGNLTGNAKTRCAAGYARRADELIRGGDALVRHLRSS